MKQEGQRASKAARDVALLHSSQTKSSSSINLTAQKTNAGIAVAGVRCVFI
jgi:hypothetical protein